MPLTAIAAVARNGVIGRAGGLPWRIPADMRHFKQTTMGGALVMGRVTYESFGSRPLPGRALFVVSHTPPVSVMSPDTCLDRSDPTPSDRLSIGARSDNPLGAPIIDAQSTGQPSQVNSGGPEPETAITPSITWRRSLDAALAAAKATGRPVFVAGGEAIYRAAWPQLTDLDLTLVDDDPAGDRHFPAIDPAEWQETSREPHDGFSFVRYRRRP